MVISEHSLLEDLMCTHPLGDLAFTHRALIESRYRSAKHPVLPVCCNCPCLQHEFDPWDVHNPW